MTPRSHTSMEARIRNFFSKRPSPPLSASSGVPKSVLKGSSYETTKVCALPVKGSYPVAGNGPDVLAEIQRKRWAKRDAAARQSTDHNTAIAEPPTIHRERPVTAPHSGFASSPSASTPYARTRSGFSLKSPPNFSRKKSVKANKPADFPAAEQVPTLPSWHSPHVDVFDAIEKINPVRATSRRRASGWRNYGEDVADRNIKDFGAKDFRDDEVNLNDHEFLQRRFTNRSSARYSYASSSRERPGKGQSKRDGMYWDYDGAGDDMSSMLNIQPATAPSPQSRLNAFVFPHHPPNRPSKPTPLSLDTDTFNSPPSRRTSQTSVKSLHIPNRGRVGSFASQNSSLSGAHPLPHAFINQRTSSLSSRRNTLDSTKAAALLLQLPGRGHTHVSPPPVPPLPKLVYREYSKSLLTPPMSPSSAPTSTSPASMNAVPKLNKALPPRPSTSRDNSANHSVVQPKYNNKRWSQVSNAAEDSAGGELNDDDTTLSHAGVSKSHLFEDSNKAPSLNGVVDLSNTVDTEVHQNQLPAVTREHKIPVTHHINEERIAREIHTHDVFHRILPVKEVEILPTAHFIPHPTVPDAYIRVPEPQIPESRRHNWKVTDLTSDTANIQQSNDSLVSQRPLSTAGSVTSAIRGREYPVMPTTLPPRSDLQTTASISTASKLADPIQPPPTKYSERHYVTESGVPRTETVWLHPPTFEPVLSSLPAKALESPEPLFHDTGYDFGGRLPGLEEMSPAVVPGSGFARDARDARNAEDARDTRDTRDTRDFRDDTEDGESKEEGEATKALWRRKEQAFLARRMAGMSFME